MGITNMKMAYELPPEFFSCTWQFMELMRFEENRLSEADLQKWFLENKFMILNHEEFDRDSSDHGWHGNLYGAQHPDYERFRRKIFGDDNVFGCVIKKGNLEWLRLVPVSLFEVNVLSPRKPETYLTSKYEDCRIAAKELILERDHQIKPLRR